MIYKILNQFAFCFFTCGFALSQETTPGVRNGHCMTYHAYNNMIILFGGADEKQVKSDTWIFKNEKWKQILKEGPPGRTFANMIYDPFRNIVVLFGGNKVLFGDSASGNTALNDTWLFNDNKWQQIKTKNSPPPRIEAAMSFNERNNTILLFGGYNFAGNGARRIQRLNDTWEFNGNDWTLVSSTGPEARSGSAMAFDRNLNACVLFGGNIRSSKNNPMWIRNKAQWNQISTKAEPIYNTSMVFLDHQKILIRYGGYDGKIRIDTTWYYSKTNDWQVLKTLIKPPARNHARMVYHNKNESAYLYGGHDGEYIFGDMWTLKDDKWIQVFSTAPVKRVENNH